MEGDEEKKRGSLIAKNLEVGGIASSLREKKRRHPFCTRSMEGGRESGFIPLISRRMNERRTGGNHLILIFAKGGREEREETPFTW